MAKQTKTALNKQTRNTLKNYFKAGRKPSQQDFSDLIDSNLNMIDEGIEKTPEEGLILSQLGSGNLLSLDKKDDKAKTWTVRLDKENALSIGFAGEECLLRLAQNGEVCFYRDGVVLVRNRETETHDIHVTGDIISSGRKGGFKSCDQVKTPILANGKWHDLIKNISGCNSFEIMAGAGNSRTRKFAMVHAVAMNADNPESIFNRFFSSSNIFLDFFRKKKKIALHHAYYNQKCDKLRLRWVTADPSRPEKYSLQIKTNCCYGDETPIKYHITRLWDDTCF